MLSTNCIVSDKDSGLSLPSSPPSSQSVLSEPSDVVSTCSASGDGLTAISGVLRGYGFPIVLSWAFAGCRGMKTYEQLNRLGWGPVERTILHQNDAVQKALADCDSLVYSYIAEKYQIKISDSRSNSVFDGLGRIIPSVEVYEKTSTMEFPKPPSPACPFNRVHPPHL